MVIHLDRHLSGHGANLATDHPVTTVVDEVIVRRSILSCVEGDVLNSALRPVKLRECRFTIVRCRLRHVLGILFGGHDSRDDDRGNEQYDDGINDAEFRFSHFECSPMLQPPPKRVLMSSLLRL